MKEEKLLKFEALAEKRVNNVLKGLQLLGNLANPTSYSYTEDHVGQILRAIKREVRELERKLSQKEPSPRSEFRFRKGRKRPAGEDRENTA